jgi:hypothetical protein
VAVAVAVAASEPAAVCFTALRPVSAP